MEIAVIWLLSMIAVGEQVNDSNQRVEALETQVQLQQKWIEDLENWNADQDYLIDEVNEQDRLSTLSQAGAHSAFYAGQQLINTETQMQIEQILKDLAAE